MSRKLFIYIAVLSLVCSCSSSTPSDSGRKVEELTAQLEAQSKQLEQKQTEIESLRDSISVLQTTLERIRSHAIHAQTDVKSARAWAVSNGYNSTLVPSIDNVLYDLDAIRNYSSLSRTEPEE